ncbi:MAG TPA: hypothetical protein VIL63_12055 [Terriglobales bacterium]
MGAKLLRIEECVQLIVFFAAIREILKREIYGADKQCSGFDENKGPITRIGDEIATDFESVQFGL